MRANRMLKATMMSKRIYGKDKLGNTRGGYTGATHAFAMFASGIMQDYRANMDVEKCLHFGLWTQVLFDGPKGG